MKKYELNPNIKFKDGNVKLKECFITFSLPAVETCIGKTVMCYKHCFGRHGCFAMPTNKQCYQNNYLETLKDTFVNDSIKILEYKLQEKKYQDRVIFIRIHSIGDFYSKEYFNKWIEISNYFKDNNRIKFQAYTKAISIIDRIDDINIQLMFSQMPDTKLEDLEKAKNLGMNIYNTIDMNADEFEKFKKETKDHVCSGECNKCLSCYLGKHKVTINKLRRNGERSKYKNENLNSFNIDNKEKSYKRHRTYKKIV
jgi:hypothetical protein